MRRFSSGRLVGVALILFFTTFWSACGGGSGNNSDFTISKFVFAPSLISLEPGQVTSVSATPYNSSGTVINATVTYTSSDSNSAAITQGGSLCAGHWDDATHTICTPSYQPGQFTITATANGATGTTTVYVHYRVDAVYLHGPGSSCVSSTKTAGVKAYACTTLADSQNTCTVGTCPDNANMCDISDQIGGFNYNVLDSTVASIDSAGTLTAGAPGTTKLFASVSSGADSATSSAVPYTTCLVDSISLHVQNATDTSLAVAKGGTATLQADVKDTAGNTITPVLTFNDTQSVVGAVTSGTTGSATYTGSQPGYGSVVASCTPPNCNKNASATFSNVVTTTVQNSTSDTGVTANETNVYATGLGANQIYPIDTTTFTLGTVISLPYTPNSMLMSHDGGHIFLGSDTFAMVVATSSNSVSTLGFPGKALAESPNNGYVIFANTSSGVGAVNIMSQSSLTVANLGGFTIPNVTAASFTPDGNTVYFTDGTHIYRYRIVGDAGSTPTPLAGVAAKDLATSANGTIVFSATGANIVADETCNAPSGNTFISAFLGLGSKGFAATNLTAIPNGSGMLGANGSTLDELLITNPNPLTAPFAGCPISSFAMSNPTISLSALGSGFTVNHIAMSHSGHYAAVLTDNGKVGIVDLTNGTVNSVALVNKGSGTLNQVYSGDFMLDDSGLWVGADDSYIHFVDIATLADKTQVQVQIQGPSTGSTPNYVNPSLVTVQPK
jgi:hypothetical protein